jgi:hypothetical protein
VANLPLAFGELLSGSILLIAAITDASIGDIIRGDVSLDIAPFTATAAGNETGTTTGSSGGGSAGSGGTVGDQKAFGQALAKLSGLSPAFINAWLLHEQPAGTPSAPGSNNWLNVGYTDSGPDSTYYSIAGLSPQAAAAATWQWLQANQPSIAAAAGKSVAAQVEALEQSGWASSHYGNESPSAFLGV